MGGIGYKLPAALFRGLQAICERVEFPGEDRQLVVSTQLHFYGVISRPNDADRGKRSSAFFGKTLQKNQGKRITAPSRMTLIQNILYCRAEISAP